MKPLKSVDAIKLRKITSMFDNELNRLIEHEKLGYDEARHLSEALDELVDTIFYNEEKDTRFNNK